MQDNFYSAAYIFSCKNWFASALQTRSCKKSDDIGPSKNIGIKPPSLSLQPKSNIDLITDFARCESMP